MAVEVHIPTPFRRLTGGRADIDGDGENVGDLLVDLEKRFPGFRGVMFDKQGRIPPHIKIYVNSQEIASLGGLTTPLQDGDRVAIIPATAGGSAGGPDSPSQPSSGSAIPATSSSPTGARRGSGSWRRPRCWSWGPADWDRRCSSIWRGPASALWASSSSTRWTSPTCRARSSITCTISAAPRRYRRGRASPTTTRT